MKQRHHIFRRENGVYYSLDTLTKKRHSLETTQLDEARRLINAENEAARQPAINLQIARAYAPQKTCITLVFRAHQAKSMLSLPKTEPILSESY